MRIETIGTATLIHGDCMEYMAGSPDKAFELAIVDPPYGIGVNHNMGRRAGNIASPFAKVEWDNDAPTSAYFDVLQRVSANRIIWGANHFIDRMPVSSPCWIVWDKLFSAEVSFASCELAYTSFQGVVKRFAHSSARPDGIHPTQKPVKLYEWLLSNYAKPGDRILDTHGGSMSSVIAALGMGFEIVCIEKDADYFEAALKRVTDSQRQQRMVF